MIEDILLIGFILFVILLLVLVFIVRNLSVRDILDEDVSIKVTPTPRISANAPLKKASRSAAILQKQEGSFKLNRENLNKFSKLLSVIGVIFLFLPLSESVKFFGIGSLFAGSILSKLTQTDKKKGTKKSAVAQKPVNETAQKVRSLMAQPEYGEALKLLYADKRDQPNASEDLQYGRAVQYLVGKGIMRETARENLVLLAGLVAKGKS